MKVIICAIMLLTSCSGQNKLSNPIQLEGPMKDSVLRAATVESAKEFFNRRMKNEQYEKVTGRRCEILKETDSDIYYGYPALTEQGKVVNALFRTDRDTLSTIFPNFQQIEGYQVKKKAYQCIVITGDAKEWQDLNYSTKYTIDINEQGINVDVSVSYPKNLFTRTKRSYHILVNKNDLACLR